MTMVNVYLLEGIRLQVEIYDGTQTLKDLQDAIGRSSFQNAHSFRIIHNGEQGNSLGKYTIGNIQANNHIMFVFPLNVEKSIALKSLNSAVQLLNADKTWTRRGGLLGIWARRKADSRLQEATPQAVSAPKTSAENTDSSTLRVSAC